MNSYVVQRYGSIAPVMGVFAVIPFAWGVAQTVTGKFFADTAMISAPIALVVGALGIATCLTLLILKKKAEAK